MILYNIAILIKLSTFVALNCNNYKSLTSRLNYVLSHMIKWFAANNLVLTLDQMNIIKLKKRIHHILHYALVTKKSI